MELLAAGGLGNFIDRLFLGYVRDFLYFKLIDFPVFNVADSYVTIGLVILIILIMFVYNEKMLNLNIMVSVLISFFLRHCRNTPVLLFRKL